MDDHWHRIIWELNTGHSSFHLPPIIRLQLDQLQAVSKVEFHQPKSAEVSEIVALYQCTRTAAQIQYRLQPIYI